MPEFPPVAPRRKHGGRTGRQVRTRDVSRRPGVPPPNKETDNDDCDENSTHRECEANGLYDMVCASAIIDHPQHGRLYITERFGGVDSLSGGAYRWRHGIVCRVQLTDTLESLRNGEHNEWTSTLDAMIHGHDTDRPLLPWGGSAIENLAKSAGVVGD